MAQIRIGQLGGRRKILRTTKFHFSKECWLILPFSCCLPLASVDFPQGRAEGIESMLTELENDEEQEIVLV